MKLTKKLEAEILKAYHELWDSNLRGDIKTFASFLDDNVTIYGTAAGEIFTTKKEAVKFYKATADQMTGKAEFRKRKIRIKAIDNTILINEQSDLYVLAAKSWAFYGHCRITAILEQKVNAWKVVLMHGSFPDYRTEDGDQINTDKIKAENVRLKDAVQRRTIELEDKNRELEIETSLERVRTVAMGMKKAEDMLDICRIITQELQQLGIKQIRNIQTVIINESKSIYLNYEYFRLERKKIITSLEYKKQKDIAAFVKNMLADPEGYFTKTFKGPALKEWIRYQGKSGQYIDPQTRKSQSLHYYFYSIGPGALGISAYAPLSKDETGLFKKFRNVFQLAYRRFIDIEKAEAQAREAQIETALERIRARALAMHSSDEFTDVARVMREQMGQLGQPELETSAVHLYEEDPHTIFSWRAFRLSSDLKSNINYGFFKIPKNSCVIAREFVQKFKSKATDYTIDVSGDRQTEWYNVLFKLAPEVQEAMKKSRTTQEKRYYHFSKFSGGALLMVSSREPSEDAIELQKRAAQVFDLAYRRFKDLQKAEALAREAQIELGLERVRARAMAMQHSGELAELVATVFSELNHLDFSLASCIIWIHNPSDKSNALWIASEEMNKPARPLQIVPFYPPFFNSIIAAWKEKNPKWVFSLTGNEKKKFERLFFKEYPELPEALKKPLSENKQIVFSASFNNFGALEIVATEPLTNEKFDILHRFGNVFNSSYTRFNDLKKAEAQAREAKIEAALERIRAASLAMQDSSALGQIIYKLYSELTKLDAKLDRCFIMIVHPDNKGITWWMAGHEGLLAENGFFVQMNEHPSHLMYLDYCKKRKKKWTYLFEGKEKRDWDRFGFSKTELAKLPEPIKVFMAAAKKVHLSGSSDQFGSLVTGSFEPLPEEQQEIISRFAVVFNQAFIRFLDLQKAEVQAREAQIEAALEKVRSRSMAMQQPEELIEVAELLRREMGLLGVEELETSSIYIIDNEKKKAECWYAIKDVRKENAQLIGDEMTLTLTDTWVGKEMWKFYQSANDRISILMKGERRREWINYCAEHSKVLQGYYGDEIPERTYHLVKFNGGYMGAASPGTISKESWDLLKRAAVVFSLAYTRFKDLQDAAARAREAQIELALERVRARSLAMHKSEELKEVIKVVLEQFVHLHINAEHAGFYIDYKTHDDMHIWLADPNLEPFYAVIPYFDTPTWNSFLEAKAKGTTLHTDLLDFKEKNKFYKKLFKLFVIPEDAQKFYLQCKGLAVSTVLLDNVGLYIENFAAIPYTNEENNILIRFGNVFQQTYTRFLDLQRAEAQARESQIQLSLERVRARSMAMQQSDELSDVLSVLFNQFDILGIKPVYAHLSLINLEENTFSFRMTGTAGQRIIVEQVINLDERPEWQEALETWKKSEPGIVSCIHYPAEVLPQVWEVFGKIFKSLPPDSMIYPEQFPDGLFTIQGHCRFGYIGFNHTRKATEEEKDILKRIANEFGLVYQRFLDLKRAEAQAREAEIQLVLERVRAKTMAMQKSDELKDVAHELRIQLASLGTSDLETSAINLYEEHEDSIEAWAAVRAPDRQDNIKEFHFLLPKKGIYIIEDMIAAYATGSEEYLFELAGDKAVQWMNTMAEKIPEMFAAAAGTPEFKNSGNVQAWFSCHYFNGGALIMITMTPPAEESRSILKRCTQVFGHAYQRFADLKKAEAQAREAQIEVALERVRSKTMAMHKSDELPETSHILFEQMKELGEPVEQLTIGIVKEENSVIEISATLLGGTLQKIYSHSIDEPHMMAKVYKAWKKQQKTLVVELKGDVLNAYNKYRNELTNSKMFPTNLGKEQRRIVYAAFFSKGMLALGSNEPRPPQSLQLLERFASVFDLTYTRFLDLQKAEAQAREAQIEAALERVRSRSLAMHSSGELGDVVTVVLNNLMELGYIIDQGSAAHLVIFSEGTKDFVQWSADPALPHAVKSFIPYTDLPILTEFWDARQKGHDFFTGVYPFDEKNTWFKWAFEHSDLKYIPGELKKLLLESETYAHSIAIEKNSAIIINSITGNQLSENQIDILKRFSKVFEQAYVRFLDLQKAEAQAREAQIEAALERVRSRSMAMHKSEELSDLSLELVRQVQSLGVATWFCAFNIYDEEANNSVEWGSNGQGVFSEYRTPREGVFLQYYKAGKRGESLHIHEITEDKCAAHYEYLCSLPGVGDQLLQMKAAGIPFPKYQIDHVAFFKQGYLLFITYEPVPAAHDIFKRFAKVFEQSYTRFLDLQKAEAQARESQIQLALERVRARTMAMQKSDEFSEAVFILFNQFRELGENPDQATIGIINEKDWVIEYWVTMYGNQMDKVFKFSIDEPHVTNRIYKAWKEEKKSLIIDLSGKELHEFTHYRESMGGAKYNPDEKRRFFNIAFFSKGLLIVQSNEAHPEESIHLLERFAAVFEQTYTRFLDLQKAEAQAREAEIELGLERVRARAMAMQKSEELSDLVNTVFKELTKLDFALNWCIINIIDEPSLSNTVWAANPDINKAPESYHMLFENYPFHHAMMKGWKERNSKCIYVIEGEEKKIYDEYLFNETEFRKVPAEAQAASRAMERYVVNFTFSNFGGLQTVGDTPLSEASLDILSRFGKVFDLTYTRFNDLQKAEAQAREAQIEAALERIRSKTMAMHKSEELPVAATLLFNQLQILGIPAFAAGYCIWDDDKQAITLWMSSEGILQPSFKAPTTEDELFIQMRKGYEQGKELHVVEMGGEALVAHYQYMRTLPIVGEIFDAILKAGHPLPTFQIMHQAYFSKGFLLFITYDPVPDAHEIFKRFANVFEQTYTRFLDLQKAEAQAREAQIEAALERVRAKAMAMHSSQDLADTIGVFYNELHSFSITPRRCGVGLLNKENKEGELFTWNTTELGESLELVGKIKMEGHPVLENVYNNWITQTDYYPILRGNEIKEYYKIIRPMMAFPDYNHDDVQYGYFFFFPEGGVYAWTNNEMGEGELKIYRRFTSALSLTYKRYKDLKIAEAHALQAEQDLIAIKEAKQKAEAALTELQATQKQLIQSEKMASLGELTAGIAHEIQNPLNFVNNFSEVSKELLDEMREAIEKGDTEDAKDIMNDVIQNLEKINHHGKRADGIVKGMLQHSRSSSGQKELTDINALCDEYLRLAYHGLRAKDKSFNVKFETSFDETVGKVTVMQQEIGRVVLNLINNAFYAVTERKKTGEAGYEPTVTVSTRKADDRILISVKDNGTGIPQKVLDKIFQPFFTTKPTGQGTGLGLSLSYDIVTKAHGGELNVETKEGEGSTFIVILPYNK